MNFSRSIVVCFLFLESVGSVSIGARNLNYERALLHTATGAADANSNNPVASTAAAATGAASQAAAIKEVAKAAAASSTGGAVEEEPHDQDTAAEAAATGTETAAEAAADEAEEKAENQLEDLADKVVDAAGGGSATGSAPPAAENNVADTKTATAEAATGAQNEAGNDQVEDAKEDQEDQQAESAAAAATASSEGGDDDAKAAAAAPTSPQKQKQKQKEEEKEEKTDGAEADADAMAGPEAVDVSNLVGAAATASAAPLPAEKKEKNDSGVEDGDDSPTGATGSTDAPDATAGASSTGGTGSATGGTGGGTGGTGMEDDAPTGAAPTLHEVENSETKQKSDEGQIEIFGDGVNPDGTAVEYAEVEMVLGLFEMPCVVVKAKNRRFRPSVSLAITGDVKRQQDVLVTDTRNLKNHAVGCATSITLKVHGKDAAKNAARYAKTIAEGGCERLRESMNHYFHELGNIISVKILQTPRVLAGNTASNAAMERSKAMEATNAAMYGVGESTAESLADHKYSNQRPHMNPNVQRLYRMKHQCKDQDCLLRIDEKLNDIMRTNDMTLGSATDSIMPR